ncbi:MAG: MarR family transcriptional regulator [Pirellulales bacterium]|nr:MarR family transcriptional regulator [Pirellulales bacterium]
MPTRGALGLEEQVIAALRRITRAIDLHSRALLKRYGLTFPQLAAVQAVARLEPVTVGALARHIHLGPATVTGILDRLERRGLVTRTRGNQDRRSVLVRLSPAGAALAREAPPTLHERFRDELSKLRQWEQTMMLSTLQRIAAMMDAQEIDASPVLASGEAGASAEEVSRYLEGGASSVGEAALAVESRGAPGAVSSRKEAR